MTDSTEKITPRATTNRVRGAVSPAEPTPTAFHAPTEFYAPPSFSLAQVAALRRASRPDYFTWLDHIRSAAACTRPVRLAGTIDTTTRAGDLISRLSTEDMPDGVIYKACGNRRATICPACARTYQRDAYQLLRAGLVGGKGVPDTVAQHPAVFATLTAPSFGLVHNRTVRHHTCTNRNRCDCRPEPCHANRLRPRCGHGQPTHCFTRHDTADPQLGQPLCLDCYDHDHQVVWNTYSGELWRRTKQTAERYLARLAHRRRIPPVLVLTDDGTWRQLPPIRLSHGKAGEFQTRGAVHFHALIRLDGVDPLDPDAIVPPPAGFTADDLEHVLRLAVRRERFTTPAHPDQPAGWPITWGDPDKGLDIKHITLNGTGDITDQQVAGYLAKYSTKSTEATGHRSTRLTADTVNSYADPDGEHTARLIDACWRLGRPTGVPAPLDTRPSPRRATAASAPWTCPDCGTHNRLTICRHCTPVTQPPVDTPPPDDEPNPYTRLRRWAHMLGYGGHFLTKARRYSITFTALRAARITHRRQEEDTCHHTNNPLWTDPLDADTTTIEIKLTFAGNGWHTTGDALLANTSAALARERQATAREELAHEIGSLQQQPDFDNELSKVPAS